MDKPLIFIIVFIIVFLFCIISSPNMPILGHLAIATFLSLYISFNYNENRTLFKYWDTSQGSLKGDYSSFSDLSINNPTYIQQSQKELRIKALNNVKIFLSPFNDIWRDLRISNKYCSLKLTNDKIIIGTEKVDNESEFYNTFIITKSKIYSVDEIWNLFCSTYDYNTSYKRLLELCGLYEIDCLKQQLKNSNFNPSKEQHTAINQKNKIDINNCSEIEMTELPGISIVLSKRAIKKREEIGGFKNIDEFFEYLKIESRKQERLKNLICINKMQGNIKISLKKERQIDL